MAVIPVMHIGNAFEAAGKCLTHLFFPYEALSPRLRSARKVEGAILREVSHDSIKIVPVERVKYLLHGFYSNCHFLFVGYEVWYAVGGLAVATCMSDKAG